MRIMDCQQCQELFSEYLDRELTENDVRELEGHLNACAHCADEYRLFAAAIALLRQMPQAECPPSVLAGVQARIHRRPWTEQLTAFFHRWRSRGFSFTLPAAAATVTIAVFAMLVIKNVAVQPPPAVTTAPKPSGVPTPRTTAPVPDRQPVVPRHLAPIYAMFASSLSPYADSGLDSPPANHVSLFTGQPDIAVTVHSQSRQDRFNLCRRLMADRRWQTTIIASDALLVTLDPGDLRRFHALFQDEDATIYPPAAREPGYGPPKRRLSVVVVLR